MLAQNLQTLCHIARAAGDAIMSVYADDTLACWQKDDQSPLTEADLQADRIIVNGLQRHFPGTFILSEESRSAGTGMPKRFFLVDPLDGTKEFLKRNGEFTVNIALIEDERPIAGVVYAPALATLYFAALNTGAWLEEQGQAMRLHTGAHQLPLRIVGSRSHGADKMEAWLQKLPCAHVFTGAGSSLKFCLIARGEADVYPRFGPTSQWDTAAAHCILEQAGGVVLDLHGQPLRYGLHRPILNPEFIALGDAARFDEQVKQSFPWVC